MPPTQTPLSSLAYARSGDKGAGANVGVIAFDHAAYVHLKKHLTAEAVQLFFKPLGVGKVIRYEIDNLGALNFILPGILGRGGSLSLRSDAQGKTLGQALLEMPIEAKP